MGGGSEAIVDDSVDTVRFGAARFLAFVTSATWEDRARELSLVVTAALVTIYRAREAKTREQTQAVEEAPSGEAGREARRITAFAAVCMLLLFPWTQFF